MNTKAFSIIYLLFLVVPIFSMKRTLEISHARKSKKIKKIHFDLHFLITQNIFRAEYLVKMLSFKKTALAVNALAQTNKVLHTFFNDKERTLYLIKEIGDLYQCSHMEVAQILNTKAAKKRCLLQNGFFADLGAFAVEKHCNCLKEQGFDTEFTLVIDCSTPLLKAITESKYTQWSLWLIRNGANINACNAYNQNVAMLALEQMNWAVIDTIFAHPHFNFHHRDHQGNTLFHYLSDGFEKLYKSYMDINRLFEYWQILQNKGIDPTLVNNKKETALDLLSFGHRIELLLKLSL